MPPRASRTFANRWVSRICVVSDLSRICGCLGFVSDLWGGICMGVSDLPSDLNFPQRIQPFANRWVSWISECVGVSDLCLGFVRGCLGFVRICEISANGWVSCIFLRIAHPFVIHNMPASQRRENQQCPKIVSAACQCVGVWGLSRCLGFVSPFHRGAPAVRGNGLSHNPRAYDTVPVVRRYRRSGAHIFASDQRRGGSAVAPHPGSWGWPDCHAP